MTMPANLLFGHTSEDTALVVDDYPYGFVLRTQIRYWLETTKHGDRFVSQTLNPKTDRWNKPKKSTYADVGVMYLNDDGHVKWTGISVHAPDERVAEFQAATEGKLSVAQLLRLAQVVKINGLMKKVTFEIRPTTTDA